MNEGGAAARFVARIVEFFATGPSDYIGSFELLGTRADGQIATVLYRENPQRPVLGERFDLAGWAELFDPELSPEDLADIAVAERLLDPTGYGTRLDVDWADGLVDDPSEIEWVGFGEPARDERIEMPDKPGTSYSGSYSAPPT